jgi:membrane-associated phospholipid phosphatase
VTIALDGAHGPPEPGFAAPPAVDPGPATDRGRRPTASQLAWGAWALVVGVTTWHWGLPRSRTQLFLVVGLALLAATAGNRRAWARVVRDWFPLFVILSVYDVLRGEAQFWGTVHIAPQIHADKWLFGGVPTLWLQHELFTPGRPHWWDYGVFFVYLSHFFVAFIVAAVLWKVNHERFRRFAALFVGLTLLGFATYAAFPAAPPWLASQTQHLAPTARIIDEMWTHVALRGGAQTLSAKSSLANPVAAMPSLHAAYPMFLMLFFWPYAGRWRWLLALYPVAMGFTLVYSAEHYVIDILVGWLYAIFVIVVGGRLWDRWNARRRVPDGAGAQPPADGRRTSSYTVTC